MNRETTCFFSGHRKIKEINISIMTKRLKYELEKLIEQGVDTFIFGGDVGFDLVAASMVIALKELGHSHIKLVFERNLRMVNSSSYCICYFEKK